ncbi:hypothetical protein SAMN05216359_10789 [Roseateles sp. YR242]|uniref:hypothetical protein n=1 Tax=Roseateles sp. YR242 TaxID=1855305 RepID=UPI0008C6B4BD|nr:hypothetical protein [Roseateles sp. YR242]SEL28737.1 hypothetical protein SAMN05216359_10789 [Roseateles sp. YR242]
MSSTSFKAFAFGIGATIAVTLSIHHHQAEQVRTASIIKLEPVYITGKRADKMEVKQLPTVYITGSRASQRGRDETLAANTVACATQLC